MLATLKDERMRWPLYVLVVSALHFGLYSTLNSQPAVDLRAFEAGQERAPFQFRVLTVWILSAAGKWIHIPAAIAKRLPPKLNSVEQFVLIALTALSLVAAYFAVRAALRFLLPGHTHWSNWGALLVVPMAYVHYVLEFGHPCCSPFQAPYDLPAMACFSVSIWLMLEKRLAWLAVVFIVATLNRESSVFLIPLWLLATGWRDVSRPSRLRPLVFAGFLTVLWFAIRIWVRHLFPDAAPAIGTQWHGFEIHVRDNIGYIARPYYWTSFMAMFACSWPFIYANWRMVPDDRIRRMLWIGPVYLAAMYVVGVLSEIRIFGELIPLMAIALTLLCRSKIQSGSLEVMN